MTDIVTDLFIGWIIFGLLASIFVVWIGSLIRKSKIRTGEDAAQFDPDGKDGRGIDIRFRER